VCGPLTNFKFLWRMEMKYRSLRIVFSLIAVIGSLGVAGMAQQTVSGEASTASSGNSSVVPQLVNYSGTLTDAGGKPLSGVVGVTFSLYADEESQTPLWMEIQNVQVSKSGHYSVVLGSTTNSGLPQDVFVTGEARWLGVQAEGQAALPRVLLVAVPYALKAGDAETIGGLPASAFMLANGSQAAAGGAKPAAAAASNAAKNSPPANPAVTGTGTVDYIPMWDTTSDIIDSIIFQKSSEIGISTTTPAALLDVNGKTDVRDTLTLFPKSTDSTLAVNGTSFKISSTGEVTFITGQTFPGAGTITGVTTASGSGLSGGGTTGTLSLKVPSAGITNAMLANSKVTLNASTAGGLTVPGAMTLGDAYTIGLKTCSTNQVLQYNGTAWACATAGTGTVTSVASGSGLTGGPITSSGTLSIATSGVTNAMLENSKVTLNSGTGISAPGAMTLGDTYTVSINTAVVPQLGANNTFTGLETLNATSTSTPALTISNTGWDGIDISAPGSEAYGIWITNGGYNGVVVETATNDGVISSGGYQGGYFSGASGGTYSENSTDSNGAVASYAYEFGTTQQDFGFWGFSASDIGVGVYGQAYEASATGMTNGDYPAGVWGDSGIEYGFGVLGSADDGWAFVGYNDSSGFATLYLQNNSTGGTGAVLQAVGSNGSCAADVNGSLGCTGGLAAVASVSGAKQVGLSAIHSAEDWFEDAGSGQLSGGEAVVNIESVFGETINAGVEYHVFLTPNGDCKGLYVAQKSATSFVVKELSGGTSSIAFDYRIMAKRKGFESVRLADKTQLFNVKNRPNRPVSAAGKRGPNAQEVRKQVQSHAKARTVASVSKPVVNKKQ
jgi:hypothetical protein